METFKFIIALAVVIFLWRWIGQAVSKEVHDKREQERIKKIHEENQRKLREED